MFGLLLGIFNSGLYVDKKSTLFDGVDEYATATLGALGAPMTVTTRVKWGDITQSASNNDYVFSLGTTGTNTMLSIVRKGTAPVDGLYIFNGNTIHDGPHLPGQTWVDITCVLNSAPPYIELYINGGAVSLSSQPSTAISTNGVLSIGRYDPGDDHHLKGNIGSLDFWNVAFTPAEVLEYYSLGVKTDPEEHSQAANIVSLYPMGDGDTQPTLRDTVGGNNATMVNFDGDEFVQDVRPDKELTEFMIFDVKTDNIGVSNNDQFTLPVATGTYTDGYTVDWGDGTANTYYTSGDKLHTFPSDGTYEIKIYGNFLGGFLFNGSDDPEKIIDIKQWGTDLKYTTMANAFRNCPNLDITASDAPDLTGATTTANAFRLCTSLTIAKFENWDVSTITAMNGMFQTCSSVTEIQCSSWDVSNVGNMGSIFNSCSSLTTLDVSSWDTSSANAMTSIFSNCTVLNPLDISGFDVSGITNMSSFFNGCDALAVIDVSSWTINASLGNCSNMFRDVAATTIDLTPWASASLTNLSNMFTNASSLTTVTGIGNLDMTAVTNVSSMFNGVTLSTTNYDSLLIGWEAQSLIHSLSFDGGSSTYSAGAAATARANIISNELWTIVDGGPA